MLDMARFLPAQWDADPHWDGGPGGQVMELFERKRSAMVEKILGAARRASLAK